MERQDREGKKIMNTDYFLLGINGTGRMLDEMEDEPTTHAARTMAPVADEEVKRLGEQIVKLARESRDPGFMNRLVTKWRNYDSHDRE